MTTSSKKLSEAEIYRRLAGLGVNVDEIKGMGLARDELNDLYIGIKNLVTLRH
ncbi:hypothetical protein [Nitrososphaera sp.]|uniref:hypothetical protein n=1 Tax=Nitrososphaera sp. TaxID=1971748 RepID=UPI00307F1F21